MGNTDVGGTDEAQPEEEHRARLEEEVDQTKGRTRDGGPTEEEPNR